ncbi:MAG: hypothetical protein WCB49_02915 [Gammaproteobacteria bacterium]
MSLVLFYKAFVIWLGILMLAMTNGAFREGVLIPRLGSPAGLVLSGGLLSLLILSVTYAVLPWLGPLPESGYWCTGLFWLALTLTFEFGFGRLVQHKKWTELLEAYTFRGGNIWPLVLAVTTLAPWLAARLRDVG